MRQILFAITHVVRCVYYIAGIIGLLLVVYFAIDMQKPVLVVSSGKIANNTVRPGDKLKVDWVVTTYNACHTEVHRHLWGSCGIHQLESFNGRFPGTPGRTENHRIVVPLPLSLEPGKCHYRAEAFFYCNPLSNIFPQTFVFPDLAFEVKEK